MSLSRRWASDLCVCTDFESILVFSYRSLLSCCIIYTQENNLLRGENSLESELHGFKNRETKRTVERLQHKWLSVCQVHSCPSHRMILSRQLDSTRVSWRRSSEIVYKHGAWDEPGKRSWWRTQKCNCNMYWSVTTPYYSALTLTLLYETEFHFMTTKREQSWFRCMCTGIITHYTWS